MRHVALLRGINVGGRNKLPMKDLAAIFTDLGCADVRTYIQSGNVVYAPPAGASHPRPDLVSAPIAARVGLQVPVLTRTASELADALANNPFLTPDADPKALHVLFLAHTPTEDQVADLDPDRSPGDRFEVRGREVYTHCPNGVARTKLTNVWFDRVLTTASTGRNWRTVTRLAEMAM